MLPSKIEADTARSQFLHPPPPPPPAMAYFLPERDQTPISDPFSTLTALPTTSIIAWPESTEFVTKALLWLYQV